jgi:hypothetical protein
MGSRGRGFLAFGLFASLTGLGGLSCGKTHGGAVDANGGGDAVKSDACTTLECAQVDCSAKGLPTTSISGTVFAPNGTLPLYGVNVYVPFSDPGALSSDLACDRCGDSVPGGALALTVTDDAGHFELDNVPAASNIPVVIQVGKWRRQIIIPAVSACQDTPVGSADTTLPKSISDATPNTRMINGAPAVDLPHIAITTGGADALECLILKLGIAPSEITNDVGSGHVHLYTNNHIGKSEGAKQFEAGWPGGSGAIFGDAEGLWNSFDNMSHYDIVMFSCEGGQFPATKTQAAMEAVQQYADMGGRVFMTHWHNIWIGGEQGSASHGIPSWEGVATWNFNAAQDLEDAISSVDTTQNPKGSAFSAWLDNVGASTTPGQIPISGARYTCQSNDPLNGGTEFLYIDPNIPANDKVDGSNATELHTSVQDLQFTTPVGAAADAVCGKVVFSDMHVSSGSTSGSGTPYPGPGSGNGCAKTELSPQEKALAFIFFDIASCVGQIQ